MNKKIYTIPFEDYWVSPDDWELPSATRQNYLRNVVGVFDKWPENETVVICSMWYVGAIELNDTWEAWRHPLWVYANLCKYFGYDKETKWDDTFDIDDWWLR